MKIEYYVEFGGRIKCMKRIKRRVCKFPDIFSMTEGRPKGTKSRREPRSGFRVASGQLGDDWSMFIKE